MKYINLYSLLKRKIKMSDKILKKTPLHVGSENENILNDIDWSYDPKGKVIGINWNKK